MVEFKQQIKEISNAITETNEFKTLVASLNAVKEDSNAVKLFQDFQEAQAQIQAMKISGNQPTQDQIKTWQDLSEKTEGNELIKKLSESEMAVNSLLEEVNSILTDPLNELYK